jgi:hypothetical protein
MRLCVQDGHRHPVMQRDDVQLHVQLESSGLQQRDRAGHRRLRVHRNCMLRDGLPNSAQQRPDNPHELLRVQLHGEHDANASPGRVHGVWRDGVLCQEHHLRGHPWLRRNVDERRLRDGRRHLLLLGLLGSELWPSAYGRKRLQYRLQFGLGVELTQR